MRAGLRRFVLELQGLPANQTGQDNAEYALVTALISVAAIVCSQNVASAINNLFVRINASIA